MINKHFAVKKKAKVALGTRKIGCLDNAENIPTISVKAEQKSVLNEEENLKKKRRLETDDQVLKVLSAQPAYQRFAHLVSTTAEQSPIKQEPIIEELTLKQKLKRLFNAAECVIQFKLSRDHEVTLRPLIKPMENICKFDFLHADFACLFTVYPAFYNIRYSDVVRDILLSLPDCFKRADLSVSLAKIAQQRMIEFDTLLEKSSDIIPDKEVMNLFADYDRKTVHIPTPQSLLRSNKSGENTSDKQDVQDSPCGKLSLLEKIKLKEKKRQELIEAKKDLPSLRLKALYSRLPLIALALESNMLSTHKRSVYLSDALKALMNGMKLPISRDECEQALRILAEVAPMWISVNTNEFGTLVTLKEEVKHEYIMQQIEEKRKSIFE